MEGFRIEAYYSGTAIKPAARDSYETCNSGAGKTWHGSPHASTKVGGNKCRSYTSTYAPRAYRNTTAEI